MSVRSVATSFNCSDICRGRESKSSSKVTWSISRRLTDDEFFSSTSRSNSRRSQRNKPRLVEGRKAGNRKQAESQELGGGPKGLGNLAQALAHLRQHKALVFEFERLGRFFSTKDQGVFIFDKPL